MLFFVNDGVINWKKWELVKNSRKTDIILRAPPTSLPIIAWRHPHHL